MVVTDYATRWVEAFPLQKKDAITVASVLYREVFARFGAPSSILTDQGKEFNNSLLSALCTSYGIKKLMATTKKSSTNGLTERFNRTLVGMLAIRVSLNQTSWDEFIHSSLFAYRSSVQGSTGKSPYELLFGTKMRLPIDVALAGDDRAAVIAARNKVVSDMGEEFVDIEFEALAEARELARRLAREQAHRQLAIRQDLMRQRWLKVAKDYKVEIGEEVYIKSEREMEGAKAKKLRTAFTGPYVVVDIKERGNLLLRDTRNPNANLETWHITKVKPVRTSKRVLRRGVYLLRTEEANGLVDLYLV
jgi:hypothetical protein